MTTGGIVYSRDMGADAGRRPKVRPKVLYLVTEDWIFCGHRLPTARAARDAGFEVLVATRVAEHGAMIEAEGFRLIALDWRRRNFNPLQALRDILAIAALYRREAPDIVHHVALKPVVFGGLAAWLAGTAGVLNALTGLGSAFSGTGRKLAAKAAGWAARAALGPILRRPNSVVTVENPDDAAVLTGFGMIPPGSARIIRGSGVDIQRYQPAPEPEGPFTVGVAARLLRNKGIPELAEAQRLLRAEGLEVHLLIAGTGDPDSPTNLPESELADMRQIPGLTFLGHVDDVRELWARCHVACLPSHREGLPMALMEAAACGRAIVATDVPGCREIALAGRNALLVPPRDPKALAAALRRLAEDADLRRRFAVESRRLVESDLAADQVAARVLEIYRELLKARRADGEKKR